jgi:tight adherence protein C
MIAPSILSAAALLGLVGVAGSLTLMTHLRRQRRVWQRLHGMRPDAGRPAAEAPAVSPFLRVVVALGSAVARSGILSAKTLGELEQTLVSSGLRGRNGIGLFIGSKLLLFAGLPVAALLVLPGLGFETETTRLAAFAAMAVGMLVPDMIVRRNRQNYLERVDRGVADAIDMLVICAQAGLGLETALRRVAIEILMARPEMAGELTTTLSEMRIAVDSQRAITNLGTRTGLSSLKRVASTLVQTMQFGTPLTEALRVLSVEMRQDVLVKFEERAARLPVLLTMPMILFIFPCIFIVIGGPAALQIMKALAH